VRFTKIHVSRALYLEDMYGGLMAPTDQTMKSLMGFLYAALTDGEAGLIEQNERERFICWHLPGTPIDKEELRFVVRGLTGDGNTPAEMAEDTAMLIGQASRFARLVDFVPDATSVFDEQQQMAAFERGENSLARLYERVLKQSQVANIELTPAEKEQIERYINILYPEVEEQNFDTGEMEKRRVEGPVFKTYKAYQQKYEDAVLAYNTIRVKSTNPATPEDATLMTFNGPMLRNRVKAAKAEWETSGRKNDVEKMQATITALTQRDLNLWKVDLLDRFDNSRLADSFGQEFFLSSMVPAGVAFSDQGWSKFTFKEKEVDHYSSSRTNQWEAQASLAWKLSFSAEGSGSSTETKQVDDVTDFELECAITQVPLTRAWFDPTFLESRAWKFGPSALELTELSDGGNPPQGMMVAYPTNVIFARDIRVNFKELHDETNELTKTIKAGGKAAFGLFKLSGSYKRDTNEKKVHSEIKENGVTVSGLQILGFRCRLLKKTPNPLPSIENWV
jgi:hypothetical protein